VVPGDTGYPEYLFEVPRQASDRIQNMALAKVGRQVGLNAIITGALIAYDIKQEEQGVLWFKGTQNYIQVQIRVEVYDTETGAKLLDKSFGHKVEVEETEPESTDFNPEIHNKEFNEAMLEVASDMAEAICEAMQNQPWRGYVTSAHDGKIILSSGTRAGLKPGDILEVYDSSNIFQGVQGQQFFLPGLKTAEIKITAVTTEKAEAVVVAGEEIKPGSSLRPKASN
ncbi:MAG: hypothetical protein KKH68_07655, partial [Proteobacteria bacterium]|nr:hypothetical protein [Pseudomonadota bacterium]